VSAPRPGSIWRHSKSGNPYIVVAIAKLEATGQDHVVYRRHIDTVSVDDDGGPEWNTTWIRPLYEWDQPVWQLNGAPRFVPADEDLT
jgi:hypothetical protein